MASERPLRTARRTDPKDTLLRGAYLVLFAIAGITCFVGIQFLRSGLRITERTGHVEIGSSATPGSAPFPEVVPEQVMRVGLGGSATIKFSLRDRTTGSPMLLARPSAFVLHEREARIDAPVVYAGNGTYEVAFASRGPGNYDVVLSDDGVPVATREVDVAETPATAVDVSAR